jgi:hypothetical protein
MVEHGSNAYHYTSLPLPTKTLLENIKYLLFEGCSIEGVVKRLTLYNVHEADVIRTADIYKIIPLSFKSIEPLDEAQ